RSELRKTVLPAFRVAPLDEKGLALDVAELPQTLPERREKVRTAGWPTGLYVTDFGDPHRPLRPRRERPRSRGAKQGDELALWTGGNSKYKIIYCRDDMIIYVCL